MTQSDARVTVTGKLDGGNPQDDANVRYEGDDTFTVTPAWDDDPGRAYGLRFAVMVDNPASAAVPVTLNIDWQTTQHMEYKSFYFLNREGDDDWREIEAKVKEATATVRFVAKQGVSYLARSPMYNYSKYLAFVDALDQRAEADVKLAGRSREKREIWRLQIPPKKSRRAEPVVFICRNNACESAGNYMIEGMVRFLFSGEPEAVELMRHFTYYFLPMTNPDGVFNGLERDTALGDGADLGRMKTAPDPAHDAIRKILEAVRPAVFVNLHDWMMGDVDGLLCNDELYARRLSDLLPPVGRVQHTCHREWYSDAVTEVEDRGDVTVYPVSKLSELHKHSGGTWKDFCRESFGSRAMAVEFPWRGRSTEDMRQLGAALLQAVSLVRRHERVSP